MIKAKLEKYTNLIWQSCIRRVNGDGMLWIHVE